MPPALADSRETADREPFTITQILNRLLIGWSLLAFLTVVIGLLLSSLGTAAVVLFVITMVVSGLVLDLLLAKKKALHSGMANAWAGFLQVAAWDPTEGVLFLKDKKIEYVDSDPTDGGGLRLLFPFFGEEEVCRVPLEVQTSEYSDEKVLTREYVPLKLTGTIYWRIADVAKFYLLVSREIHKIDDRDGHRVYQPEAETRERGRLRSGSEHQLEAAEEWLRLIAEEQTRSVVARVRTGLLVAEEIAAALPPGLRENATTESVPEQAASGVSSPSSSKSYRSAAEGLGDSIREAMAAVVPAYGICVDRVSLQEVRLPEGILARAVEACTTAYQPLMAHRRATADKMQLAAEAEGRRMLLAGEADVVGPETVAKREVIGSVQPFAMGGRGGSFLDFLAYYFEGTPREKLADERGASKKQIAQD